MSRTRHRESHAGRRSSDRRLDGAACGETMLTAEEKLAIERRTAEIYEDIHPFTDIEYTIDYYLKTLGIEPEYFRGKHVVDCGFGGTGWASELFARSGAATVSGVDLNPRWAERLRGRLAKYDVPTDLRPGNVLDLPFEDERFDYVHSHGVMHHTVDWKRGVSEMVRVLKPGGAMYLGVYARFGPLGRAIYWTLRSLARIIPYSWAAALVKKTGFLRYSEYSILDLAYVPVEEHLSEEEVLEHLRSLGIEDVRVCQNYKWRSGILTHPLLFGKTVHHAFFCTKKPRETAR
jgi:ubiquinone/menaquinone biosynthesis C-methylase UbiE